MHKTINPNKDYDALLSTLQKKYGAGVIMSLGMAPLAKVKTLPSGSYELDRALGVGGLPWGRIIEIYGMESSGKTTLALHAIAEAQKMGHTALFIDAEHAFDPAYAKALGIQTDQLLITQPDYGEQALDIAHQAIHSGVVKIVVIDSVSALIPEYELKHDIGSPSVGTQARMMSQAMRKLTANVHKAGAICIFINQVRNKVGIVFGSPEVTSGGNALKFYASIRLKVAKGAMIKDSKQQLIGHQMKIKVVKNKVAPPFQEVCVDLTYGEGIASMHQLFVKALAIGIIKRTKAWYAYRDKKIGQGKENVLAWLKKDIEMQTTIAKEVENELQNTTNNLTP